MSTKWIILITPFLIFSNQSFANDFAKEWCDAYTAQSLISLAANRIYGHISEISDSEYQVRSEWVNTAYKQSEIRFKKLTGYEFQEYESQIGSSLVQNCQLIDQIQ